MSMLSELGDGLVPDEFGQRCAVDSCDREPVDIVEIVAFDPIDHDDSYVYLCDGHLGWAEERNALARELVDQLREARREIGQEHAENIAAIRNPADGEIAEAASLGVADDIGQLLISIVGINQEEVIEP